MRPTQDDVDRPTTEVTITELHEAVARLQELRQQKEEIEKEMDFCSHWIDEHVKVSSLVQIGERYYKATPVRSTTTKVDERRLKRLLPDVALRVTRTELVSKIDTNLLAHEIEKGNVPLDAMKQFLSQTPKKTSIRISEYRPGDEDPEENEDGQ